MENRFGFKDLIQSLLLLAVIASIWLGMKQYDRQWEVVRTINKKTDTQIRELSQLRRLIKNEVMTLSNKQWEMVRTINQKADTQIQGLSQLRQMVKNRPITAAPSAALTLPPPKVVPPPIAAALPPPTNDAPPPSDDPFVRIKAAQAQPGYAPGDWLVDAFSGGVAKITPLLAGDNYASIVQSYVLDSLATRDPDTLEWKGLIAKNWKISGDGMKITFRLRKGVTFSDGHPLTASDVVFTFNHIMNDQIAAPRHRAYLKTIDRVEMTGAHEVVFHYGEPYFEAFELAASLTVLPKHFYSAFTPEQFNQSVGLLMGSGPYQLEDPTGWKPGKLLQLVRNERYWGTVPAFDRLIFKEITNDVARQTAFRNGDIDLFAAQPQQYRAMLLDDTLAKRTQHYEYLSPLSGYRYIAWNQKRQGNPTRFADKRVRQAMTLLTDRNKLVQEIMLSYAEPATGPFNPRSKQVSTNVQLWPYDVQRAKQLLQEAGFTDQDGDGVLESKQGEPFRFKLTYPSGSANYEKMVLFLKDAYAKAGIIVEPDPLEWSVFTDRLKNKNFQAITLGWTSGIETDIYQMFHSSQRTEGGDNFISYKNQELDHLIKTARHTVDESARMPMWHRCHEILHEDQPYTFLFFSKSLRFIDNRVQNVHAVKLGLNPRDEWWVPQNRQRWDQ